jgi:hypothetical protein
LGYLSPFLGGVRREVSKFDQFGLHATLSVKTRQALYYKSGGDRLLTIILVRDKEGGRPDQMFYRTQLDWDARPVLSTYACRWAIETDQADSISSDRWCEASGAGYHRRRRAA